MGEIKSTLDLVMERTRHLSMSTQEKLQQRQANFAKRLQGLLQQYADGAMAVNRLRDRINALQAEFSMTDREPVLTAIIERIDPEKDNQSWLALLADLAPAIGQALEKVIETFQKEKSRISAGEWAAAGRGHRAAAWHQRICGGAQSGHEPRFC